MSKTFAYLRVSTSKQDTENQRIEINDFCKSNGLAIDEEIAIEISSRKDMKKRHIDLLLNSLKSGDTLIVSELSRLGRSIRELAIIIEELQKKKITFIAIKQNMRFNGKLDMTQKVMLTMFSLFAELERDMISQRTKNGLERARQAGKVLGNPNLEIDNKVRFENALNFAENHRTLLESFINQGLSQRSIVKELNNLGIKTRSGRRWSLVQVQRLLKKLDIKTK